MKRKVIALITSLLISGSVGVYAAGGNISGCNTSLQTALSQNCPKSAATVSSVVNAANALNQNCPKNSASSNSCSGTSSQSKAVSSAVAAALKQSCPKNSNSCAAASNSTASASQCPKTANSSAAVKSAQSGSNATCASGNCAKNQSCKANSCTNGASCPTGNCTQVFNCSGSNCSQWLNSLLANLNSQYCPKSGTTTVTSKPASSAPAASKPASSAPAQSTPANTSSYADFQNEVVRLVNQQRAANGLGALTVNSALTKTATLKSQDMAKLNYFSHTSPTYGSPFDEMKQFGISYRTAGENIAMGQKTPAEVMNAWMNSAGHRANILNSSFTKIGVGIAKNANGQYIWTQQFIG